MESGPIATKSFGFSWEEAQAEAVGQAIAGLSSEAWDGLTHQQRQILLVAQATVRHYPHFAAAGPLGVDRQKFRKQHH